MERLVTNKTSTVYMACEYRIFKQTQTMFFLIEKIHFSNVPQFYMSLSVCGSLASALPSLTDANDTREHTYSRNERGREKRARECGVGEGGFGRQKKGGGVAYRLHGEGEKEEQD